MIKLGDFVRYKQGGNRYIGKIVAWDKKHECFLISHFNKVGWELKSSDLKDPRYIFPENISKRYMVNVLFCTVEDSELEVI